MRRPERAIAASAVGGRAASTFITVAMRGLAVSLTVIFACCVATVTSASTIRPGGGSVAPYAGRYDACNDEYNHAWNCGCNYGWAVLSMGGCVLPCMRARFPGHALRCIGRRLRGHALGCIGP